MRILGASITLAVSDPAASSGFFCTHLGFRATVIDEVSICLERDDLDVEIVLRRSESKAQADPEGGETPGVRMGFEVTDLAVEQDRLFEEGASISTPLHREAGGLLRLRLTDPNRVDVELTQWTPPAGC
ncbi:glyoxalase [Nocardia sp. ET3-3]|uniref:Glyoxalase n=1 Tax=Nocardia terrae TaxID=2675851 RepID=A0A7K1V577_9NOCA|nr:VOC family protein [Nocardia terrae]MVU81784.1 glyoxalase [Nocardia terrae]